MARRKKLDVTSILEMLRANVFEVDPDWTSADSILVAKYGAAAVLDLSGESVRFAVTPGSRVGGELARLVDRGYQKFFKTKRFEVPATADRLHALHRFSEELKQLLGLTSFMNEGLGTTGDLYQYDRLKGRPAGRAG
jgi:hypothetical protein